MRRALLLLQTALDDYLDGGLVEAALSDIVGAVGGEATFGALVGGTVVTSFWLAGDGDLATPAVLTVLIGVLMFPLLPAGLLGVARVISFIGLVAGILAALEKYALEGSQ